MPARRPAFKVPFEFDESNAPAARVFAPHSAMADFVPAARIDADSEIGDLSVPLEATVAGFVPDVRMDADADGVDSAVAPDIHILDGSASASQLALAPASASQLALAPASASQLAL